MFCYFQQLQKKFSEKIRQRLACRAASGFKEEDEKKNVQWMCQEDMAGKACVWPGKPNITVTKCPHKDGIIQNRVCVFICVK